MSAVHPVLPIAVIDLKSHAALMGTIGGKIGLAAGVITGVVVPVPMIWLVLGSCFFEHGCGASETLGLFVVVSGTLLVALAAGLVVRMAANHIFGAGR
jgi:hypothetical protein